MGTFVELRCENHTEQCCKAGIQMGRLAFDTQAGVLLTLNIVEANARKNGWRKTRQGWLCAYCATSTLDSVG